MPDSSPFPVSPLWDMTPLPTMLFDSDASRAACLAAQLEGEGLPVEVTTSTPAMLELVRKKRFRTLFVVTDIDDVASLKTLGDVRRAAPNSLLIAISKRTDIDGLAVVRRHGVDALVRAPVSISDLFTELATLQVRSRPHS